MIDIIKGIFSRRHLLKELIVKNLKVRYSQPALGFFWAFLSPFLTACILYVVFAVILKVRTTDTPFFLYLVSALFPWHFFQDSVFASTSSLVENKNLIRESSFPYYLIPISVVLTNAIIFLPPLCIILVISALVLKGLPVLVFYLPLLLAAHIFLTAGLCLICSILYVRWRDIKYIIELTLLFLFYITPVFYPLSLIRETFPYGFYKIYTYNPFVGVLSAYRAILLKGFYAVIKEDVTILSILVVPAIFTLLVLMLGFYLYNINKKDIYDYLSY